MHAMNQVKRKCGTVLLQKRPPNKVENSDLRYTGHTVSREAVTGGECTIVEHRVLYLKWEASQVRAKSSLNSRGIGDDLYPALTYRCW